jgi:hypothetical protein
MTNIIYSAVRMPKSVIDRAHENGLNASAVCQRALNEASEILEWVKQDTLENDFLYKEVDEIEVLKND